MTLGNLCHCTAIGGGVDVTKISLNQKVFSMISSGRLFWSALTAVFCHIGTALKVFWLPFTVSTLLFMLVTWYDPYGDNFGLSLLNSVSDLLLFGMIAIGWHRFRLLKENPNWYGTSAPIRVVLHYAVDWFFVGLAALLVAALIVVPTVLLSSFLYTNLSGPMGIAQIHAGDPPPATGFAEYIATSVLEFNILALIGLFCVVWLSCVVFFRLAIRLPAIATGTKRQWLNSRLSPSLKNIVLAGFWSAAYWCLVIAVSIWLETLLWDDWTLEELQDPPAITIETAFYLVLMNTFYGISVLFGASYLTELFRETFAKHQFLDASGSIEPATSTKNHPPKDTP